MEHVPSPDMIKVLSMLGAEIRSSARDSDGIAEENHANGSAWVHRFVQWPSGEFSSKKAGTLEFSSNEVVNSGGKTYVTFAYSEERALSYALIPSSGDADPMVFKIDDEGKARGRVERVVGFIGRLKKVSG